MIVLGVDPGARSTGLALIDYRPGVMPTLLASTTVTRARDDSPIEAPPTEYLDAITRPPGRRSRSAT